MTREYSAEEIDAMRAAGLKGQTQFATGPYWPDELERRADVAEALIPKLRLAAYALRREIAAEMSGVHPS